MALGMSDFHEWLLTGSKSETGNTETASVLVEDPYF